MGWWRRLRPGPVTPNGRRAGLSAPDFAHVQTFAATRVGVEIFLEPATTVTPWTVVLIARDGEWTRRACADPRDAATLGRQLGLPVYDVKATGYPRRMREWNRAHRTGRPDGAAGDPPPTGATGEPDGPPAG